MLKFVLRFWTPRYRANPRPFAVWSFSRTFLAFRITPPLPLEKIAVYPHRLDAARVIRLGAVIKKEPGQPNSQTL